MAAIERHNPALADVLPRDYVRPALDKQRLGRLVDLVSNIRVGDEDARSRDVLGRVYEYFLSQFGGGAAALDMPPHLPGDWDPVPDERRHPRARAADRRTRASPKTTKLYDRTADTITRPTRSSGS